MFTFLPWVWAKESSGIIVNGIVSWIIVLGFFAIKLPYVSKYQPSKSWAIPLVVGIVGAMYMNAYSRERFKGSPIVPLTESLDLIVRSLTFNRVKLGF
jgi:hypothetical protein